MGPGPTIPSRITVRFKAASSAQVECEELKKNTKNWEKDNLAKDSIEI